MALGSISSACPGPAVLAAGCEVLCMHCNSHAKSIHVARPGSSTVRAPVFDRHQFSALQSITEKPMEVYYLDELIIITQHVACFLHPAIF